MSINHKKGFTVQSNGPSQILLHARQMAGAILQKQFRKHSPSEEFSPRGFRWIKPELTFPSFEHFTFAYKSQLFPVFIDIIIDGQSTMTENERSRFLDAATEYNLIPCVFKMNVQPQYHSLSDGEAKNTDHGYGIECVRIPAFDKPPISMAPLQEGWNLFDLRTDEPIDPEALGTDERIRMSEWELQSFACQIVRDHIQKEGGNVDTFCDLPIFNPQIYFNDKNGRRCWVIVRHAQQKNGKDHTFWYGYADANPHLAPFDGFFASVSSVSSEPSPLDENGNLIPPAERFRDDAPLFRCDGMFVKFEGLQRIHVAK